MFLLAYDFVRTLRATTTTIKIDDLLFFEFENLLHLLVSLQFKLISDFIILHRTAVCESGLLFPGSDLLAFLNIGLMVTVFHCDFELIAHTVAWRCNHSTASGHGNAG